MCDAVQTEIPIVFFEGCISESYSYRQIKMLVKKMDCWKRKLLTSKNNQKVKMYFWKIKFLEIGRMMERKFCWRNRKSILKTQPLNDEYRRGKSE